MTVIFLFFWSIFILCYIGWLFRQYIKDNNPVITGFSQWALDFALGSGLLTYWLLLSNYLFGKIYFGSVYLLLFIFTIWLIPRNKNNIIKSFQSYRCKFHSPEKKYLFRYILCFLLILLIGLTGLNAWYGRMGFDSWFIYGLSAKSFYFERTILPEHKFDFYSHVYSIINYRFIIPMTEAWIFYHLGESHLYENISGLLTFIYYLALISLLYMVLKKYGSPVLVILILILTAGLTPAVQLGSTGMVDLPLSFYILAGLIYFQFWYQSGKTQDLILSGLFILFSAMTKYEGRTILLLLFLILWLTIFFNKKSNVRQGILFTLICLIGFVPYYLAWLYSFQYDFSQTAQYIQPEITRFTRFQLILENYFLQIRQYQIWGLCWLFIFIGLVNYCINIYRFKNSALGLLWLILILQALIYILFLQIHPGDIHYFLSRTTDRLLFHLTPGFIYISFISLFQNNNNLKMEHT